MDLSIACAAFSTATTRGALIDTESWDSLHLLLFLCQCHVQTCLARMYADRGGRDDAWSDIDAMDEDIRALATEDCREYGKELEAEIEAFGVRATLTNALFIRVAVALVVCPDGIVDETPSVGKK